MSLNFALPPGNLYDEIDRLEDLLRQDSTGEHARTLRQYFTDLEMQMRAERAHQTDFYHSQMANLLAEAFSASARSVVSTWNALHGKELST